MGSRDQVGMLMDKETKIEEPIKENQSTETVAEIEPEPIETPKKKKTVAVSKRKSTAAPRRETVPDGYRIEIVEKRTRRVQIYLPPSLYAKAEKTMKKEKFNSMNDYINYLVEQDNQ